MLSKRDKTEREELRLEIEEHRLNSIIQDAEDEEHVATDDDVEEEVEVIEDEGC